VSRHSYLERVPQQEQRLEQQQEVELAGGLGQVQAPPANSSFSLCLQSSTRLFCQPQVPRLWSSARTRAFLGLRQLVQRRPP